VFESAGHFAWDWLLLLFLALAPVSLIEVAKLARGWLPGRAAPVAEDF
jgi:hypothetical protein